MQYLLACCPRAGGWYFHQACLACLPLLGQSSTMVSCLPSLVSREHGSGGYSVCVL